MCLPLGAFAIVVRVADWLGQEGVGGEEKVACALAVAGPRWLVAADRGARLVNDRCDVRVSAHVRCAATGGVVAYLVVGVLLVLVRVPGTEVRARGMGRASTTCAACVVRMLRWVSTVFGLSANCGNRVLVPDEPGTAAALCWLAWADVVPWASRVRLVVPTGAGLVATTPGGPVVCVPWWARRRGDLGQKAPGLRDGHRDDPRVARRLLIRAHRGGSLGVGSAPAQGDGDRPDGQGGKGQHNVPRDCGVVACLALVPAPEARARGSRQSRDHELPYLAHRGEGIPAGVIQEPLRPIRSRVPGVLGDRPAVAPRQVASQRVEIIPGLAPPLHSGETPGQPIQQLRTLPPGEPGVYPALGSRLPSCCSHKHSAVRRLPPTTSTIKSTLYRRSAPATAAAVPGASIFYPPSRSI